MRRNLCALLCALMLLTSLPAQAAGIPAIKVMGSNGTVTVGVRTTPGAGASHTQDGITWVEDKTEFVYTTDGMNWTAGTADETLYSAYRGYYAAGAFWVCEDTLAAPGWRSADGVHWTKLQPGAETVGHARGMCDLGPYHFQLDSEGNLWVMRGAESQTWAGLPAVKEWRDKRGVSCNEMQAYYGPNGTVTIEVYDQWDYTGARKFTASYATSSLDWIIENQSRYRDWDFETYTDNGNQENRTTLYLVNGCRTFTGNAYVALETSSWYYSSGSIPVPDVPWGSNLALLPYNGKTFLVRDKDTNILYATEDGHIWKNLKDTFLYPEEDENVYSSYSFAWTGSEYITCRRVARGRYGMAGAWGGDWASPYNTKVSFCDANFQETGSYDFGRQVEEVGYWNGYYCAVVSENTALTDQEPDTSTERKLYVSKDKLNWERTDALQWVEALMEAG